MVKLNTLMQIAAFGGVATVGTAIYLQQILQNRVRRSDIFKDVINEVLRNTTVVEFLGKPVKFGSVDVSNPDNYLYANKVHLNVPVKGSKVNGNLEFWGERESKDHSWKMEGIELEIKDEKGGRINLLNQEKML